MIVVQLIGGLGNQMFQYALGRSLADRRKVPLKLDVSWFDNIENVNTQRQYELGRYGIKAETVNASDLNIVEGAQNSGGLMKRFFSKPTLSTIAEPDASFHPEILELKDNVYLKGYWQNENYFKAVRPRLLEEFVPLSLSAYTKKTARMISEKPSVSVHIRRGDYASNPLTNKFHGLVPIEYYLKALKHIQKKTENLQVFVFSDDIKWCRSNLPFAKDASFVNGSPPDRACEDIYLMSLCSHNIVANSSFSWWGAWLNKNPNKIVAAPKFWFKDKTADKATDIVPRKWLRL